jgi:protein O-GlcNAc transferase
MGLHYREAEDGEAILKAHRDWAARHEVAEIRFFTNPPHQDRRLRIGYVSPDFWTHSVANFVTAPLRHHDRAAFHVSCYSDVLKPDDTTRKLRALADVWRDVRVMDDRALAERVIADEIDILINLAGHTADNRLKIFGRRVVPIQMTWVGYPATSGLKQMDYRVSDSMADPPGG